MDRKGNYQVKETVLRKLSLLSIYPRLGRRTSKRADIRQLLINKRVALIYRFKPVKKEIELLRFWGTGQDPRKKLRRN